MIFCAVFLPTPLAVARATASPFTIVNFKLSTDIDDKIPQATFGPILFTLTSNLNIESSSIVLNPNRTT